MFPPTPVAKPLASSISPTSVVVVLFPFEPVIPTSLRVEELGGEVDLGDQLGIGPGRHAGARDHRVERGRARLLRAARAPRRPSGSPRSASGLRS